MTTPSDQTEALRLFEAVRQVIREGIDAPAVYNELHAAFYAMRDATPAPSVEAQKLAEHGTTMYATGYRDGRGAAPLDVERLAGAMQRRRWSWLAWTDDVRPDDDPRRLQAFRNAAVGVAAEYAALRESPENGGGE